MRWDEQRVEEEDAGRLFGLAEESVLRTFDAPEAMGINFHEVRAKSALNRVPGGRYGFGWTINPYRGCTHACVYCAEGDTQILMGDGRTKDLRDLRKGDIVYGTVREGGCRRYVLTPVLDHWRTTKPSYRIRLEDGTQLIASGDHRFLTAQRGWKYVTGAEQGHARRPHLTPNSKLMGTGRFAPPPGESLEYQRGYLCGLIKGGGHIGYYSYARANGDTDRRQAFRLALTDDEALQRARRYLLCVGVKTRQFEFAAATERHRSLGAIRTQARDQVAAIRLAIEWPGLAGEDWCKGFLAGIFDAEGHYSESLRISNTDREIIDWIVYCMRRFGFSVVEEHVERLNPIVCVRVLGGLCEHLRFFHTVDPAITRKRSIVGRAIKTNAKLRVESIEPIPFEEEPPLYDITTGTGDFIANGVVSHNCFARRTHPFLDFNAGRDFEREIVVKVNVPELLRAELARPSWKRELVALGTNTDPYQWVESRYRFMPEILAALEGADTPVSVLTKSPLVLRDIDLYERMAKRLPVSVNLSVPTLDEDAWRATEPHTPSPTARLDAVAELRRRGIDSGVLIAPLMPGINDDPEQVQPIVDRAKAAGATFLGGVALHLRDEVRDVFFAWLEAKRPDLIPRYEKLYSGDRAYMRPEDRKLTTRAVRGWGRTRAGRREKRGVPPPDSRPARKPASGSDADQPAALSIRPSGGPPVPPSQGALF
jgi:DNA repair photolyase